MHPLSRITGTTVDRVLGLPAAAVPYVVRRDVAVAMPDGVVLLGDHYRPAGISRPLPAVLIRSPYGRAGLAGILVAAPLARRGFQVFMQSTRGTFGSGGQFRPFTTEQEDGLATVAWLRDQPWCDGQVSMTGASYLGHTQWAVAPYADPPLRSVSLNITAANMHAAFYQHGVPNVKNALNWTGLIGRQERGLAGVIPSPWQMARMRRALRKTPLQAADVDVAGAPVAFWRDFVQHAGPGDGFWAAADHGGADLTRLPPVSMVTGWWDLFLPLQLRDYAGIRAAGVTARIIVGPWLHGEPAEVRAIARQDIAWLDHQLRGGPAPPGPPVRLFLQQAGIWLGFDQWPPPAAAVTAYYLRAPGRLGRDAEPGDVPPATFVYDPADPTPSAGGPLLQPPGKQVDNRAIEARPDVLTYTTDPLPAALELVGPVTARVHVRTSQPYADVFVRVCDVDANGVSRNITDGIRRLDPLTVPAPDARLGDDGVVALEVELYPTAYRVRAGHRLRVQVSGGAFPRFARNFGTAEPFGAATRTVRCRFEIHHDSRHPACVLLPVLAGPVTAGNSP
ncbi:MAG: CocE/NonD family hydrolase [Streptosporangiaceae bacterium]|nr:CocE/NonD family hydrolase [Streptosporangiaceae bacterium]